MAAIAPRVPPTSPAPPIRDPVDEALEWISFTDVQRAQIIDEGFDTFEELASNSNRDIMELASGFAKRTVADRRINFGLRHTRCIKAMVYWALDFQHCSETPTIAGMIQASYLGALENATRREDPCPGVG